MIADGILLLLNPELTWSKFVVMSIYSADLFMAL